MDSSCKRCCRNLATGVCSEYQPVINVADGRSCVQGYCENVSVKFSIPYSNMTLTFFPLSIQKAAPCENL